VAQGPPKNTLQPATLAHCHKCFIAGTPPPVGVKNKKNQKGGARPKSKTIKMGKKKKDRIAVQITFWAIRMTHRPRGEKRKNGGEPKLVSRYLRKKKKKEGFWVSSACLAK